MKQDLPARYVPGIDGLRAVAVLSVVAFHINHHLLPGGFTGVDVFFVISGYVISKSLTANFQTSFGRFLIEFYKRRLLRIMPALVVCLLLTGILSTMFIPSVWLSEANEKTGLWAFFGLSNFALLSSADGYFDRRIPFNPYVHTWSLAVEEQFYLIFPVVFFLFLLFRTRSDSVLFALLLPCLAIASLAFAAYETKTNPNSAFYMLPSRFWQMAAGALLFQSQLAGLRLARNRYAHLSCMAAGTTLIIVGFVLADDAQFPFPWALAPVLGTVLMIAALSETENRTAHFAPRLFESRPAVYIGKISYSLYLWHWPVIVLMRWTVGVETMIQGVIALTISVACAVLSYHFVELPTRQSGWAKRGRPYAVVLSVLCATGLSLWATSQVFEGDTFPDARQSVTQDRCVWRVYYVNNCAYSTAADPTGEFDGRSILIAGDSHAISYHRMVTLTSKETGAEVLWFSQNGCSIVNLLVPVRTWCGNHYDQLVDDVESKTEPGDIVFLASLRMKRFIDAGTPLKNETDYLAEWNSAYAIEQREQALLEAEMLIQELLALDRVVLIDLPKPVFKAHAFQCSDWFNKGNPSCDGGFSVERSTLEEIRSPVVESLMKLAEMDGVYIWDPFEVLCPGQTCDVFAGGLPLFTDGDHLSGVGNSVLQPSFKDKLADIWSH